MGMFQLCLLLGNSQEGLHRPVLDSMWTVGMVGRVGPSQSDRSQVIPVRTGAGEEVNEVVTIVTAATVLRLSSMFIDEKCCVGDVESWPCLLYE